jgi:predicted TPR repeat methyltransferase
MASVRLPVDDPIAHAEDLIAAGRGDEAAKFLADLLNAGRGGLLTRLTLARAYAAVGDVTAAMETARETAMLNPSVAVAALGLGEAMLAAGNLPTAVGEFQRALRLDPDLMAARVGLGDAWLEAGEAEKALEAFAEVDEQDDALKEKIAEAEAMRARPRSDAGYVRHLFDQFSTDYDVRMRSQLSYRAPEILREMAALILLKRDGLTILDLGCGTGLAGVAFKDMAARLDGIDLSPAMIQKARALGIYDDLKVGDIETGLAAFGRSCDLVLAADTVVYLGDLAPLLPHVASRLAPDGMFLFTVEKKDGDGFELGPKRRWRHSDSYLRDAAAHAGMSISGMVQCSPRMEAGVPVAGLAVAMTR